MLHCNKSLSARITSLWVFQNNKPLSVWKARSLQLKFYQSITISTTKTIYQLFANNLLKRLASDAALWLFWSCLQPLWSLRRLGATPMFVEVRMHLARKPEALSPEQSLAGMRQLLLILQNAWRKAKRLLQPFSNYKPEEQARSCSLWEPRPLILGESICIEWV